MALLSCVLWPSKSGRKKKKRKIERKEKELCGGFKKLGFC